MIVKHRMTATSHKRYAQCFRFNHPSCTSPSCTSPLSLSCILLAQALLAQCLLSYIGPLPIGGAFGQGLCPCPAPIGCALLKEVLGEPSFLHKPFFFVHKLALGFDLNCLNKYIGGGVEGGVGLGLCKSVKALPGSS